MSTTATTAEDATAYPDPLSLRLRAVLAAVGIACLAAFWYGNSRTEEFRLHFARFEPWLWNLYLTTFLAGGVGALALGWSRRWGFWTIVSAGALAALIGVYAMGFTLIGAAIVLAVGAVWLAVQPDWEKLV